MTVTRVHASPSSSRPKAPLLDSKGLQDVLYNRALPASSALGKVAKRIDSEWGDANIMSGVVTAVAGHVHAHASDAELKALASALLERALKETDDLKPAGAVKTTVGHADAKSLSAAARTMAVDGFVYTPSAENIKPVFKDVQSLVKALGPLKDLRAIHAQATVKHDDLGKVPANAYVFANYQTGDIAVFYSRQGST